MYILGGPWVDIVVWLYERIGRLTLLYEDKKPLKAPTVTLGIVRGHEGGVESFCWGPFFFGALLFISFGRGAQELGTVTRIVVAWRARIVVAITKPRTVVAFGLLCCPRVSKVSAVTGIGGRPGRETQNCRRFRCCLLSSQLRGAPHFVFGVFCFCFKLFFRGSSLACGLQGFRAFRIFVL